MHNYSDLPSDFKLIQIADAAGISWRNARIFSMFLSGLGIDSIFHEFLLGVFTSQNWDKVEGMAEIPLKKIAQRLAPDQGETFSRVYNRLKKNKPEYFRWQDQQTFTLVESKTTRYNTGTNKTHTLYGLPHFKIVNRLFNLQENLREDQIRVRVLDSVRKIRGDGPAPAPRRKRRKKPESTAKAMRRLLNELVEEAGSIEAAAIYIREADEDPDQGFTLKDLLAALLKTKDLT